MMESRPSSCLRVIPLLILACCLGLPAQARYGGGSGTVDDPYLIYSAEQLHAMGDQPGDWDKHFKLMADIDLSSFFFVFAPIASDRNHEEPGFQGTPFTGVFDGDGHTISRLRIAGGSYLGLFGKLGSNAHVRDLGLLSANVVGAGDAVGILAGQQGGSILRCYSTGSVEGSHRVGGLVGHHYEQGYNTNQWVHIISCYSTASVTGDDMVAGLVGENDGTVSQCHSVGSVSKNDVGVGRAGGLVVAPVKQGPRGPYYGGYVNGSFWDVETSGQQSSGGGLGCSTIQMQNVDMYRSEGWDFLGEQTDGLHETWKMPDGGSYPVLSIFDGYAPPELQGTGTGTDPFRIRTKAELSAVVYYPRAACYRLESTIDLYGVVWPTAVIPELSGLFDGHGNVIRNVTVSGGSYLGLFGRLNPGSGVMDLGVVEADVTGTSINTGILVGISFAGTVTNCHTHGSVAGSGIIGGLMGYNWSNLGLVDNCQSIASVSAYRDAGGLVGANVGTVIHCFSTGSVEGDNDVGGLVGESRGPLVESCSTCVINGRTRVGGLVGYNNKDPIQNCCSHGPVSADENAGGLIGLNEGNVTNCYSTGRVTGTGQADSLSSIGGLIGTSSAEYGTADSSFWDIEASGQPASDGGIGKSTAEMNQQSTFKGWDFVNVWGIGEGQTYPYLRKYSAADVNQDGVVDWLDFAIIADLWMEDSEQ